MRGHYGTRTSVGAGPVLGAGAVSGLALVFVLLGPIIGTAATVALLRGDPTKRSAPPADLKGVGR